MKVALILASACLATPVAAADTTPIPVVIHWQGLQPDSIFIADDGGSSKIPYDPATKTFTKSLPTPSGLYDQRTLLLHYSDATYPLILNVRRGLTQIEFSINFDQPKSCADLLVKHVEVYTDNMDDALRMMLTAAAMLKIPPNNQCYADRYPRTVKARFDRNANLASYSKGLFGIDPDAREALLKVPGGKPAQVAAADRDAKSALAGGMYRDMISFGTARDFDTAANLGDSFGEAIKSDTDLAQGFKDQGITADRLEKDASFFHARAAAAER